MDKRRYIYESIMQQISSDLHFMLFEKSKTDKKKPYTTTYVSGKIKLEYDEETLPLPKNAHIKFHKNELDKYVDKKLQGFSSDDVHICDPYMNKQGKLCFDIESDIPFDTKYERYGHTCTLEDLVFSYLRGQISDGWGENAVGTIQYKGERCFVAVY